MKRWLFAVLLTATVDVCARPTLLVTDFELVDELRDPASASADQLRLARAGPQFREALSDCSVYRLVDSAEARSAIALAASQNAYLYRCNGCAAEIGAAAKAEQIAFTWVQKVSTLILNFNVEVRERNGDSIVVAKSVDVRGNTDESWMRGVKALARRLCEGAAR